MMNNEEKKNRIRGMLVGCAMGDAMGMPSEMMSREDMEKAFPQGIHDFLPSAPEYDFIGRHFEAGQVTDDTVNTLLVCQAVIDGRGVFDTMHYISLLQEWIRENAAINPYVIGPSTSKALDAIAKGTPVEKAGQFGTTNGSCMKVSPLGIISDYRDLDQLSDNVSKLCLPTHNNSVANAGASVIAACCSYALRGGYDMEEMWELAYKAAIAGSKHGRQLPAASLTMRLKAIYDAVIHDGTDVLKELRDLWGTSMETIETVPAVLAIVTLSNGDPVQSAELSANLCGDTDTIGAIAGAVCGAMNPTVPEEKIHVLELVNHINFNGYTEKLAEFLN